MLRLVLVLAAVLPLGAQSRATAPPAAQSGSNETCAGCHDVAGKLAKSAHASVACLQCHLKHEQYPHPADSPKPACSTCHGSQSLEFSLSVHGEELKRGNAAAPNCDSCHGSPHEVVSARTADFKRAVPATCGMCHSEVQEKVNLSVHGRALERGVINAPVCTDCHGEHSILRPVNRNSQVSFRGVRETCGRCHGDLRLARQFGLPADRLTSFDSSFHGLAAQAGAQTVANCASCHGFHDVLPSSDPQSMTHPKNLPKTCGACHPGAGTRFALGPIHTPDGVQQHPFIDFIRGFYLFAIPATIGLMILHHGGDFVRKFHMLRIRGHVPMAPPPHRAPEIRMVPFERILHAGLAISFLVLVWSGFALKYPHQWWASPFVGLDWWPAFRSWTHRIAGLVLIAVALSHFVSLIVSPALRKRWLTLIPRRWDVVEGVQALLYNLGLRRQRPRVSPHSYVEKVEYWAVVWGTAVMAATGLLLWASTWALANLPKLVLDIAKTLHFYEAVLAALAILVWHFYTVFFDPEVYPMDMAWLTGRSPRRRDGHGHGDGSSRPPAPPPAPPPKTLDPA